MRKENTGLRINIEFCRNDKNEFTDTIFSIFALYSSIIIVDPTAEEESLSTALLTVVTDEEDRLCAVHKPGEH